MRRRTLKRIHWSDIYIYFRAMDLSHTLCLLLCAAALSVSGVLGKDENSMEYVWTKQHLPVLLEAHTQLLNTPMFRAQEEEDDEEGPGSKSFCGIECQSTLPPMGQAEQEQILGYETMYENGTRTHTDITLQGFNKSTGVSANVPKITRRKRQVYGADGRFVISDSQFSTNYPFSSAVRLSTGCSGVLVSPKHVLTAAHCIHDGKDYLEGTRKLKVGVLQIKTKRRKGGRKRGGRGRGGRRGQAEQKGDDQVIMEEEDEEQNSIDGNVLRRKGGRGRRRKGRKDEAESESGGDGDKQEKANRIRRSAEPRKQPIFRWARVKQTRIPQGWILPHSSAKSMSPDYNYALLELKRPLMQRHMELGVAPSSTPLARIHFSGYDTDKSLLDGRGDGKVVYRFCSVSKESNDLMYQQCDAQVGATGAGVYVRLRQQDGDAGKKGKWQRRVIGVFTGHQWMEDGDQTDFNVAVRITPTKYAQICHWIHGDPSLCKEI